MLTLWLSALVTGALAQDTTDDAAPADEATTEEAPADEAATTDEAPAEDAATEEAAPAEEAAPSDVEAASDTADAIEESAADVSDAMDDAEGDAAAEEDTGAVHTLTVGLGAVYAAGNSEFVLANGELKYGVRKDKDAFELVAGGSVNYGRVDTDGDGTVNDVDFDSDGDGTADQRSPFKFSSQRVFGNARYDRFLSAVDAVYVRVGGEHDYFAGLSWRLNQGVGYHRDLVGTDATTVKFETGLEVVEEDLRVAQDDTGADINTGSPDNVFMALRVFLGVTHAFNEHVSISNDLELIENLVDLTKPGESTPQDFRLYDTLALNVTLSDIFSLKISNRLAFDNLPAAPEFSKVDNTVGLTLVGTIL